MNSMIKKIIGVLIILVLVNAVGFAYHHNYNAGVIGSVIGAIVGFIISEMRTTKES